MMTQLLSHHCRRLSAGNATASTRKTTGSLSLRICRGIVFSLISLVALITFTPGTTCIYSAQNPLRSFGSSHFQNVTWKLSQEVMQPDVILPDFEYLPNEMTQLQLDSVLENDDVILGMYAWEWDPNPPNSPYAASRAESDPLAPEYRCGFILHVQTASQESKMMKFSCPDYPGATEWPSTNFDFERTDLQLLETNRNKGENIGPYFLGSNLDDELVIWDLTKNELTQKTFLNGRITHTIQTEKIIQLQTDQFIFLTTDNEAYWECNGKSMLLSKEATAIGAGRNSIMFYVVEKSHPSRVLISVDGYVNCSVNIQYASVESLHDEETIVQIHGDIMLTSQGRLYFNDEGIFKPIPAASGISFLSFHTMYWKEPNLLLAVSSSDRRIYYWEVTVTGYGPFNKIVGSYATPSFIQYVHGRNYFSDGAFIVEAASCFNLPTNDPYVCSGHGRCIGLDKCLCSKGFTGERCATDSRVKCNGISASNPDVCSGRGKCVDNVCICDSGAKGDFCSQNESGSNMGTVLTIIMIIVCSLVLSFCCLIGVAIVLSLFGIGFLTYAKQRKQRSRHTAQAGGWVKMMEDHEQL